MHQRTLKTKPLEVILFEIDMFRHCVVTIPPKKANFEATGDPKEYFLAIEGFLLHLRNLLSFFMNRIAEDTDLGINDPNKWAEKPVEQRAYSDLMKLARDVNDKYTDLRDQISKFLAHCTTYRYQQYKDWDVEGIFADFDPILKEFEQRFAPHAKPVVYMTPMTTTISTSPTRR